MIVNECITGQDKKAYEQKLGEDLSTGKILDEEYQLIKKRLFSLLDSRLLMDSKLSFEGIVCTWIASTPNLTESQKKLNRELLNILKGLDPCYYDPKEDRHCEYYVEKLTEFLRRNKNSQDLKTVLNLKRGESGLTVLHLVSSVGKVTEEYNKTVDLLLEAGANPNIQNDTGRTPLHYTDVLASAASLLKGKANPNIQDNRGETPLHYAASIDHADYVNLLIEKKADSNMQDKKGATPLQIAIDNHHYYIEECFFTDKQKNLSEELYFILNKCFHAYQDCILSKDEDRPDYFANFVHFTKSLKEFLDKHKNSEDLKMIFSIRYGDGSSKILNYARAINKKVVDLFLSAGAIDPCKEGVSLLGCRGSFYNVGEKYFVKSTLWNTQNQVKLNEFLSKISKVQDMYKLEEVVNEAIKSGIRLDLSKRSSQGKKAYNFVDHVIEKISRLEKNPKVASNMICKLVSRGAVFDNKIDVDVVDALESEFEDHKANMIKAHENYISNAHKFIEVAKSATNSELNDVRIDNSTLYLEYSEDSTIDVAKITDGARSLGLTQGNIEYERNVIKIGKSEVEFITQNGIRNYTDLADGGDIVLTFYTSERKLDVRLYPDVQNENRIKVEVNNRKMWEKLKSYKEKIGKNCLLGELSVNEAIKRGFFARSGKLCQHSETISSSAQTMNGRQQLLQDLRNIESNIVKKEKNFDIKTHLIDIFKTLSKLLEEKENVSKTDLANAAERESKRLGLEGRYNWNELFGLEEKVPQNVEQEGSSLPLSNDLCSQDKLASSVNNEVVKYPTEKDGNCFFHAVFGSGNSGVCQADKAKELRQEWHKFLSQFESLSDPKMPQVLKERLSLVFHNVFPEKELDFYTGTLYKEYLNKINKQDYFIFVEEVPILASLANIEVEIHYTQKLPDIIKPNSDMINADYKRNQELWNGKVREMIYHEGSHYSRAEVTTQLQEQKDSLCYSSLPKFSMDKLRVEEASHQNKALLVSRT